MILDEQPEFAIVLRGYDRTQVDQYVDTLRNLAAERDARWRSRTDERGQRRADAQSADELLTAARRTAEVRFEAIVARAEGQAARLLGDADAEANTILAAAREQAARRLAEADSEAARRLAEADSEAARRLAEARAQLRSLARAHAGSAERLTVLVEEVAGRLGTLGEWQARAETLARQLVETVEPLLEAAEPLPETVEPLPESTSHQTATLQGATLQGVPRDPPSGTERRGLRQRREPGDAAAPEDTIVLEQSAPDAVRGSAPTLHQVLANRRGTT
jgi:cell division septum initiation protein DivIVA